MKFQKIEIGDQVYVMYIEYSLNFEGIVTHVPSDCGDMWHIQTETEVIAINPSCSILFSISKKLQ